MPVIKLFPVPTDGVKPQSVHRVSPLFKDGPIFTGTGNIDYLCGHCGAVMYAKMNPGQIDGSDAALQCPQCRGYNKLPIRGTVADPRDPFESPKLSLKWAKEHIEDFETALKGFIDSKPYHLVAEINPQTGECFHKLKLRRQVPDRLRRTARDAIQGLRATLDHAMFVLVKKDRYFPFREDVTAFEKCITDKFGDVAPEIVDVIRQAQPYKGGNDLLWAMNKACNPNKHGLIKPIATTVGGFQISGPGMFDSLILFQPKWDSAKNEMIISRSTTVPGRPELHPNLQFAFDVVIGDVPIVEGKPAVAVLNSLAQMVETILVNIEAQAIRVGAV